MRLEHYYEDLSVQHVGAEEPRAWYMPCFPDGRDSSILLSDDAWKLRVYPSPEDVEEVVVGKDFDTASFDTVPVPSTLEMLGYVQKQYTNVNYPFPYDPPYVLVDNTTAVFIRDFDIQKKEGRRLYLYFEGVDSAYFVYLNGSFIGYSEVPHSPTEFDVTSSVTDGRNRLSVIVLKYSDGSYLEDQDKFRWSGIFRDVYLMDRPEDHIVDFEVKADMHGSVTIDFLRLSGKPSIKAVLSDPSGTIIASGSSHGETLSFCIPSPHLWSAEDPYLYDLSLVTEGEIITEKVGCRSVWVENKVVLFNGKAVKFLGANRHESNPRTGAVVTKEDTLRDLQMMKASNFNTIRTSHYPDVPWFYRMCDEYGFYVVSEADVECHGVAHLQGGSHQWNFDTIARDERFLQPILDRNIRNVEVNKNSPSVFMWSLGNESGYGLCFERTAEWVKRRDPSRLVHYEGATHSVLRGVPVNDDHLDNASFMYNDVAFMDSYFPDPKHEKPAFLCEYIHSMGNGPGDTEDYIEVIRKHDEIMGGCAWEWCDHATYEGEDPVHGPMFHYGGDAGEYPHDGNFCLDGLVYPDRRPHTGLLEYANVLRPVRASVKSRTSDAITLSFRSYYSFRTLAGIEAMWHITAHGVVLLEGKHALSAEAGGCEELAIALPQLGDSDAYVDIEYRASEDMILVGKGTLLGSEQLQLQEGRKDPVSLGKKGEVRMEETEKEIIVSGKGFEYRIDKRRAVFTSILVNGSERLSGRSRWTIWRAPTDNDRKIKLDWKEAEFDRADSRAVSYTASCSGSEACIVLEMHLAAVSKQPFLKGSVTIRINGEGKVHLSLNAVRDMAFPFFPRLGMAFSFLSDGSERCSYYGYGPYESYVDKHRASRIGRYEASVASMHEDYIVPQENGSHFGVTEVEVGPIAASSPQPFSFNASYYTAGELERAAHNYELVPSGSLEIHLDYRMSGIGSGSCGPQLMPKYQLSERHIDWDILLSFR